MMLRFSFGLEHEAVCIENAVKTALEEGYRTPDLAFGNSRVEKIVGTVQMGDLVVDRLKP